jgi:hypothetical protein
MVGQHDAAGADADRRGAVGDVADQHRRGGTGNAGHVVVFGQPEAPIAKTFRVLRQVSVLRMAWVASLPSMMGERSSRE